MRHEEKRISLSAIGMDSPGLVSKISTRIFDLGGNIVDVDETCRRGLFSIFLIIDFTSSASSMEEIAHTMQSVEEDTGLKVVLGRCEGKEAFDGTERESHLVTVLGPDRPGLIAGISTFFHRLGINIESCRMIARGAFFSMEMVIDTRGMSVGPGQSRKEGLDRMKTELKGLCADMDQSAVIQSGNISKKMKKLVVFDVESALIQADSLRSFLARIQGKRKSAGTERRPPREPDEKRALLDSARNLKGVPMSDLEKFGETLELNPGSLELIRILKSMGFRIALISSGFHFFVRKLLENAGVDYAFSNTLKVDDAGVVTGELEEPVITSETKKDMLDFILKLEGIGRQQVIAVGDGSIRSHFIKNAGLSIAFRPDHPGIGTDGFLSSDRLTAMLYCLGLPETELEGVALASAPSS
jgi:phosphoserine phosphatase